jgi:hypothetical protein
MSREWYPFPIHTIRVDGVLHVVPNERDIRSLQAARDRAIEEASDVHPEDPDREIKEKMAKDLTDRFDKDIEKIQATISAMSEHSSVQKMEFELSEPGFGEYLAAEERSKDFINGVPRVNESQLSLHLMSNRVRLNGKELTAEDIKNLPVPIAKALWEEVRARVFQNRS